MSDSVQPHRRQPTRLPCPWDSPGKNTGVGCHFFLQCMKVKSESEVAHSCPILATPWTAAYQAPLSMGFSRQEYCSGVPLPSPRFIFLPVNTQFLQQHVLERLFYTSVSLLLSRTQGYCYRLSKFHIYALVYCTGVCNPKDGSPPGFPVPGILQARTLEWLAISLFNA